MSLAVSWLQCINSLSCATNNFSIGPLQLGSYDKILAEVFLYYGSEMERAYIENSKMAKFESLGI